MHTATKKSSQIDISSEKKLEEFTERLAQKVKKGDFYFLYGEMGVGKTTFVKYFINNLQLKFNEKLTEVSKDKSKHFDIKNFTATFHFFSSRKIHLLIKNLGLLHFFYIKSMYICEIDFLVYKDYLKYPLVVNI